MPEALYFLCFLSIVYLQTYPSVRYRGVLPAGVAYATPYKAWTRWPHPTDLNIIASRRQLDFEKWWYIPRPLIAEW